MRAIALVLFTAALLGAASLTSAQPPGQPGGKGGKGGKAGGRTVTVDDMVARVFAYDTNKDGKLTKDELTDGRLHALFERADANKDGVLTKDELTALLTKESAAMSGGSSPGGFGPGSPGGPGGPGGPGFGPPQPGQVLPPFLQDQLNLTDAQKKELAALQKDVDARLNKILTDEQKKALRERGPGGFPPPPPSQ
ncbi:EF-hand domain-containing protein [Gemmata sp. JC717]|uniref:EF-hand domain-containing protein n=1 Tax=Gemmata algarum TaxID=2975278 RepID=UPI0021BAB585|nr:EF-hand domain-containing protein [Gemmata algarum]MDY3555088.1 EF-hand domain-containing protein [Gemmata algarum]